MLLLFIPCCFQYFKEPVLNENAKLGIVLAIATGASIILAKETIDTPPLAADKTIKSFTHCFSFTNFCNKICNL